MERLFLKFTGQVGEDLAVAVVMEPRPLEHGKGTWPIVSAMLDVPTLKDLGHTGISLQHYCFDRAVYPSICQKCHRRHAVHWEDLKAAQGEDYDARGELTDWVVTTACAHHDTQKALEWAVGYCMGARSAEELTYNNQECPPSFRLYPRSNTIVLAEALAI